MWGGKGGGLVGHGTCGMEMRCLLVILHARSAACLH